MSIEVVNLTKAYGEQKALDSVSFKLKKGEIVGFLGPNGAGKSTMMKILTGYIPQSEGQAEVCGHKVGEEDLSIQKKVGYLPEHNPLYLEMFVKEYLNFIAGVHHIDKARVDSMIEKVGLSPEKHKKIAQLSKGYRQRVGLAAALIHDPEVLILDEPTTGLDVNQLVEIRNLIQEAGKEKTVMLSTHIMQEVEYLCQRVIIINKGKIVADRPIEDLKNAQTSTIIELEVNKELEVKAFKSLKNLAHLEKLSDYCWRLDSNPNSDLREELYDLAQSKDFKILEIKKLEQSLEDAFKYLTQS